MKRTLALILALVLCLSFAACGKKEDNTSKTEVLTADNAHRYLGIETEVLSFEETEHPFAEWASTKANGQLQIEIRNTSGATFQNASVTLEVSVPGGKGYCWKFNNGVTEFGEPNPHITATKQFTVDLRSTGEEVLTEMLTMVINDGAKYGEYVDLSDSLIRVKIVDASGTVVPK